MVQTSSPTAAEGVKGPAPAVRQGAGHTRTVEGLHRAVAPWKGGGEIIGIWRICRFVVPSGHAAATMLQCERPSLYHGAFVARGQCRPTGSPGCSNTTSSYDIQVGGRGTAEHSIHSVLLLQADACTGGAQKLLRSFSRGVPSHGAFDARTLPLTYRTLPLALSTL